jgi:2',3'-cyclic-nucleotide 2'-phosphodiesterase (5'-nucleotidase family)
MKVETQEISIDSSSIFPDDSVVLKIIQPYKLKMDSLLSDTIAYSEQYLDKGFPESLLSNYITDLILHTAKKYFDTSSYGKIDIFMLSKNVFKVPIPEGAVTRKKIFELLPYENYLTLIKISGDQAEELFNFIAKNGGIPESGIVMGIKDSIAVDVKINGYDFDKTRSYSILTSDYLVSEGSGMTFLQNPISKTNMHIKLRDAFIHLLLEEKKSGRMINSKLDQRIYYEK